MDLKRQETVVVVERYDPTAKVLKFDAVFSTMPAAEAYIASVYEQEDTDEISFSYGHHNLGG